MLGPVSAWVDGRQVALGGQRPRALLATLALTPRAGSRLSFEDAVAYALEEPSR